MNFFEIIASSHQLENYTNEDSLSSHLTFEEPRYQPLIDMLTKRIRTLLKKLTKKQRNILDLWMDNVEIKDIALQMKINYTTVHNHLYGKKTGNKLKGGIFKRIKSLCANDSTILLLLKDIEIAKRTND
jgi:DNA-binding CsgD family transcriptional regulator